jgi:NADH-quinone oxidoreductase subunit M
MILSAITFLPLVGALVCFFNRGAGAKWIALAVSVTTFLLSIPLWWLYDAGAKGVRGWDTIQLAEGPYTWISDLGISYYVGIDGIALLLVLLTTFMTPLVIWSSFDSVKDNAHQFMAFMLVLETGMVGTFVALDTFLFYVFWELMLIPMYFIIGMWGGPRRIYATLKFFIYTMAGSLLMLVAILALYVIHHEQFGTWSANYIDLVRVELPFTTEKWLFWAFVAAFAVKVPMFPVHTWLPDAHVEAPTGGSVILAGVLLKMGTFGFIRYALPFFPEASVEYGPFLVGLAVVGIVYGALVAMVQDDIKKLVAYSSVSHMGAVMLGVFALNREGMSGAVYQMLGHGLSTGGLFLLVGMIYDRRHTRLIAEYGGLAKVVPVFAAVFLLVTLSSIGLPGLNGFVGEVLILLGSFEHHPWATVFATTGVIWGAVYMLWVYQRVAFGPVTNHANKALKDMTGGELATMIPIVVLIVFMGVYPQPFLAKMDASVQKVVASVIERSPMASHDKGGSR